MIIRFYDELCVIIFIYFILAPFIFGGILSLTLYKRTYKPKINKLIDISMYTYIYIYIFVKYRINYNYVQVN